MKFNHDESDIRKAIVDHDFDTDRATDLSREMLNNPEELLGDKLTKTMEYIRSCNGDPEALACIARVLVHGIQAIHAMEELSEKMVKGMTEDDLPEDLPEELREHFIRLKGRTGGIEDELEELRKKYH